MRLTKLQRYTAYCILSVEFPKYIKRFHKKRKDCIGLCSALSYLTDYTAFCNAEHNLFEYYNHRTVYGLWWYKNYNQRITALKQCIKETEPK